MILSDGAIRREMEVGNLKITPFPKDEQIQPTSIDLTLANKFVGQAPDVQTLINPLSSMKPSYYSSNNPPPVKRIEVDEIVLAPGGFLLGSTEQYVVIPHHLVAIVEGKSSIGRLGLMIHVIAGYIDPGFEGNITLELKNVGDCYLKLVAGSKICQLRFETIEGEVLRPYGSEGLGSKYQKSEGTVEAKPEE